MDTIAVINMIGVTEYAYKKTFEGDSAIDRTIDFCLKTPNLRKIVILRDTLSTSGGSIATPEDVQVEIVEQESWDAATLLEVLGRFSSKDTHIVYLYADCPFLDAALMQRMYANHIRYLSNYTFADGYPYGLAPEIIDSSILPVLRKLSDGSGIPMNRESLFAVIQKDINAFDLETEIAPKDYRLLRISLTCDTLRNYMITKSIYDAGGRDESSILRDIDSGGALLRTLPAYFQVQITEGCPQACSYCPYPKFSGGAYTGTGCIDASRFRDLVEQISAWTHDAVIGLGLWGEPSFHGSIPEMVGAALSNSRNSVVIETSGIGWKKKVLDRCIRIGGDRLQWIVSVDTSEEETYRILRGEGFSEAVETAEYLRIQSPKTVHVQAVRMKKNEGNLEGFYRSWKEKTDNVIIQKYDHFCGYLPDEKVTDLAPIRRDPCWHLKRDMCILIDGSVPCCKEDLAGSKIIGNVFQEDLSEIWERNTDLYLRHVDGEYPGICAECDEYYTFNF
jgi:spiro-SPASM protein